MRSTPGERIGRSAVGRDRRRIRYRAECPVSFLVPMLPELPGVAIDLSGGGSFIETEARLPLGLWVDVRFAPPGGPQFELRGKILRVGFVDKTVRHPELDHLMVRVAGMGVKFELPAPEVDARLMGYLDTLEEI